MIRIITILLFALIFISMVDGEDIIPEKEMVCPYCGPGTFIYQTPKLMTIIEMDDDYFYTCHTCGAWCIDAKWYTRQEVEAMKEVEINEGN